MNRTLRGLSKVSPLSKAIRYALNQWDALVVYVSHGQEEIDKNMAERSLRPIAQGRKNYLFTGRRTCSGDLYLTGHRKTQWPEPNRISNLKKSLEIKTCRLRTLTPLRCSHRINDFITMSVCSLSLK